MSSVQGAVNRLPWRLPAGPSSWDGQVHGRLSRTLGSILFVVSGLVQLLILIAPHPAQINEAGLAGVGLATIAGGIAINWLPPRLCVGIRAVLIMAPAAVVLAGFRRYFTGPGLEFTAIFHIVSFIWLGIACRRGVGLIAAPFLIASYIVPLAFNGNVTTANVASLVYVVPLCVLISETLAWTILRLRTVEAELQLRRDREALDRAETRYRTLVEQLPSVTYVMNQHLDRPDHFDVTYMSPQIEAMTGVRVEDWAPDFSSWESRLHPDDAARVLAFDAVAYARGEPFDQEYRMCRDDGSTIWVLESSRRLPIEETADVHTWLGTFTDITKLREAEATLHETDIRYRTLVEQIPMVTYLEAIGEDGQTTEFLYVSPQITNLVGYTPDEWMTGDPWGRHVHPDDIDWLTRLVREHNRTLEPFAVDYRLIARDGRTLWMHDECAVIRDDDGRPKYWHGYLLDISQIKESERQLRQSEAEFRLLFFNHPLPAWVFDRETLRVLEVNEQAIAHYGYPRDEFIGMGVADLVALESRVTVSIADGGKGACHHRTRDGRTIEVETSAHPLIFRDRPAMLVTAQDVTGRNALQAQLTRQAFHDRLTGLPNRAFFQERLERALASSPEIAVIFIDLDDFKRINDTLGHTAGDAFLVAVAGRLAPCVRAGDTIARLGGDEFTVLIENCTTEDALAVVERFYTALHDPIAIAGREMVVSPSIGIAIGDETITVSDELLRRADVAMYVAKRGGKARHLVFAPEMDGDAVGRLDLEADLRRSIGAGQLELYYQPVIDIHADGLMGFEALVRWNHPAHGMISPAKFIPLAEESGLIVPLGNWVLAAACAQLRRWQLGWPGGRELNLSVNISGRQFQNQRLVERVRDTIRESGVDPRQLTLEITESIALNDLRDTDATLVALRALGVRLAIDDFGAGYSGLRYLQRHRFDAVKIDRSYIADVTANPIHEAFVRAVLAYATTLGVEVVAEGVETEDQLLKLREIGITIAQGFYYSRPVPADGIEADHLPQLAQIA